MKYLSLSCLALLFLFNCKTAENNTTSDVGTIDVADPDMEKVVSKDAKIEILGEGYEWSEGPVWVQSENMLLFSDVPNNIIHKWTEDKGVENYLTPSGYTGSGKYSNEPGSNGLTLSPDGKLVLCQHGDRRVAFMDAPFNSPKANFVTLADSYEGKKLSSPNDAVFRNNGDLFFTDPPYGLPKQAEDSTKETEHNGVYKLSGGKISLVVDSLTRPNGLAFLKGEKTLIVANSDPEKATWYAFDLAENDSVTNARVFFDATPNSKAGERGLPDGLRVDKQGNVFATGPGGVWVFDSTGKVLGKIKLNVNCANVALSADDKTLFITADMYLLRVKLRQ